MRSQTSCRHLSHASLVLAIIACITAAGCSRRSSGPGAAGSPPVVEDKSLANDRYTALGFPSYDRVWNGDDITNAASRFQSLAASNPEELPRFQSDKSGKMFDRIVSAQYYTTLRDPTLPVSQRLSEAVQYMDASNTILKTYLSAFQTGNVGGEELAEWMGAELRLCVAVCEVADQFVPTIPKNDPSYKVRMEGLENMRTGFAGVVSGTLTTLTEKNSYTATTRLRLLACCRQTLPSIVPKMSSASQSEIVERLDTLASDANLRELQPQLSDLRDEVRAAKEKAAQSR